MLNKTALLAVIVLSLLFVPIAVAAPDMQEGMWEITSTIKMEGIPIQMPPMKHTQCITKKDVVPQQKDKNQNCTMTDNKVSGNVVTWAMRCKDKQGTTIDSNGKITYKGSSFSGNMDALSTDKKGTKTTTHMQMSGKRIGACK